MTGGISGWRERAERAHAEVRWRRAAVDPVYFFEQCLQIPSQRSMTGREPFELFDYQRDDLDTFTANRFVTVLKCRQIGISTLVGAYALWLCLFRPGSVVLWVADGQDNANKAVGMLNVMWGFLPGWVRSRAPELTANQAGKKEWTFPDGMTSRIRAFAGTGKAGASETATLVVLDEFALVEDQDNLLRSATPTTDAGGALWIISTARGAYNRFARMFRAAQRGESQFVPVFHPWMVSRFVNPKAGLMAGCRTCRGKGRRQTADGLVYCRVCVDEAGYQVKAREFADQPWLFAAEYPADVEEAFRESGRPRFTHLPVSEDCDTAWVRGELEYDHGGKLVFSEDSEGPLRLRHDAVSGADSWRDYVMFVDPAQGVGGDYTAGQILTYDDEALPDRVAWWHANNVEPADQAKAFDRLGRWFAGVAGPALAAIESTGGWGDLVMNELHLHLDYPRLYSHRATGHRRRTAPTKVGFPMHKQRRPLVIDRLAGYVSTAVEGGPLLGGIDAMLRYELGTFVRRADGKVAGDVGCHDDLVMSVAGALYVLLEEIAATDEPKGEGPKPAPDLSLKPMFDQIEEARRVEAARNARAATRAKRATRRSIRMGSRTRSRR